MRRWLRDKKKNLAGRFNTKDKEQTEEQKKNEEAALNAICFKILKKADLLISFESPSVAFKR